MPRRGRRPFSANLSKIREIEQGIEKELTTKMLKMMKKKWGTTGANTSSIRVQIAKAMRHPNRKYLRIFSSEEIELISRKAENILKREIEDGDVWINPQTGEVLYAKENIKKK